MGIQDLQNYKDLLGVPILLMGFKHIGNPDKNLLGVEWDLSIWESRISKTIKIC